MLVVRKPFGGYKLSGVGSKAGRPDYLLKFLDPRTATENVQRQGFAIRMSGLFEGGLPSIAEYGWQIEYAILKWPEQMLILLPPSSYLYGSVTGHPDTMIKIFEDSRIRAYGFSYTGRSLIIAITTDVTVFVRELS